jgi:hypothetical protein
MPTWVQVDSDFLVHGTPWILTGIARQVNAEGHEEVTLTFVATRSNELLRTTLVQAYRAPTERPREASPDPPARRQRLREDEGAP